MSAEILPFRSEDRATALRCRRAAALARLRRVLVELRPVARGAASRAGASAGEGGRGLTSPLPRRGSPVELGLLVTGLPLVRREDGSLAVVPPDGAA